MSGPKPKADWPQIDWARPSDVIAAEYGVSVWTVIRNRRIHAPDTRGQFPRARKNNPERLARAASRFKSLAKTMQPVATEAAKHSPKSGKFETNVRAVEWTLIDPDGRRHVIRNLHHFIRQNPALFEPADTIWKNGKYCNVSAGISNVRAGYSESWKGWTVEDPNIPARRQKFYKSLQEKKRIRESEILENIGRHEH